jgi:hypothetical protein
VPLGGAACGAQPVGIEVDVFLPIAGHPPIEIRGALVARAARPMKLKRLFDFSYNPSLAARELAGEIARSGAANGKLWLRHDGTPSLVLRGFLPPGYHDKR